MKKPIDRESQLRYLVQYHLTRLIDTASELKRLQMRKAAFTARIQNAIRKRNPSGPWRHPNRN